MKVLAILLLCGVAVYARPDRSGERIDVIQGLGEVVGVPYYTRLGERYYVYNVKYANANDDSAYGVVTRRCKSRTGEFDSTYGIDLPDCLSMTIRTKYTRNDRPVVVIIGENNAVTGPNGDYVVEQLLNKDIVVVTIPYQTGPSNFYSSYGVYGLFSQNSRAIYENSGITDLIQALKLIQNHINQFGGDVNRITIIGNRNIEEVIRTPVRENLVDTFLNQIIY